MNPHLVDTHCHLDYEYEGKTSEDLVREAKADGVTKLVTIGVDATHLETIQAIAEKHEDVFFTVGTHPHEADKLEPANFEKIKAASFHPKCRAIGEIGLDYHYNHSSKEAQLKVLEQHLELALERNLPVVIHSREGEDDLLPRLKAYAAQVKAGTVPGIIHCFTGTEPFALECVKLGFMISFSGILTFKKADDLRAIASILPVENLLVETDSPYLAPIPHRGKKCEPKMVVHTATQLASLKKIPLEALASQTTANASRVFKF